jgi:hypothetical protein
LFFTFITVIAMTVYIAHQFSLSLLLIEMDADPDPASDRQALDADPDPAK